MVEWIALSVIKRITLLFWAAWLSAVATTNVLDALQALVALPESFKFVSGNWHWINQVMDPLGVPRGLQAALFAGAIAWEGLGATLFWWAAASYRGRPLVQEKAAVSACGVNLSLWSAFQVLDQVFLAYQPEGVHRVIFVSQLATLLLLHLLPDRRRQSGTIEANEIRAARGPVDPTPGSPRF
jgi:hypothetical protein